MSGGGTTEDSRPQSKGRFKTNKVSENNLPPLMDSGHFGGQIHNHKQPFNTALAMSDFSSK